MKASAWQAAFLASIILLGAAGLKAQSSGETQTCTNATLTGPYGYVLQGSLVNTEEEALEPYADMGSWTADGNGNISGSGTQSFAGTIETGTTITGTYTVNANCTGSATLTYGNSIGSLGFNFTVVNNGEGLRIVQTTSGFIVSGGAQRQATNCVLESLNGSYSFNISGSIIDSNGNVDPYVDSGQITFNGTGNFSVIDTNSLVGTVASNRSFSGTYMTSSNCTGTLSFTDPTFQTALHMNLAIVDGGQGIRFIDTDASVIFSGTATALGDVGASGTLAHVAAGAGWLTTFTLTNTGTSTATFELSFFDNNGNAVSLPLMFLDSGETTTSSALSQTLAAGATVVIATNASNTAALVTGSAQLTSNGSVGGFAIFHYNPTAQEAVVPLETRNASAYILAFDNTNGLATGLALANVSNQAATVPVIVRDDVGTELGKATIDLAARGHTSFLLATEYGFSANRRGTIEFDTPANGQISALGLRAASTGTLTTVPVLAK